MAKNEGFTITREQALQAAEEARPLFSGGTTEQEIWKAECLELLKTGDIMHEPFWRKVVGWSMLISETLIGQSTAHAAFIGATFSPDGEGIAIDVQARTRKATEAYSQLYTRTAMEITLSLQRLSAKKKGKRIKRIGLELEVGRMEFVPPKDKQN